MEKAAQRAYPCRGEGIRLKRKPIEDSLSWQRVGFPRGIAYEALSDYYKNPSEDLIPNPEMEIRLFSQWWGYIEALTYQDRFGYDQGHIDDNRYYPELRKSLNPSQVND